MAATIWDSTHSSTNNAISGGNLIVTIISDGIYGNTLASNNAAPGTYYWELLPVGTGFITTNSLVGLAIQTNTRNEWLGLDNTDVGYASDGHLYNNNASVGGPYATYNCTTDIICMAFDNANNKLWVRVNGGGWQNDVLANQNPVTNTGGYSLAFGGTLITAAVSTFNNTPVADTCTAYFSAASWHFVAPSGFLSLAGETQVYVPPVVSSPDIWLYPEA